jgi:hypothetical protein
MAVVTCATLASAPSSQQYVISAFDVTQATFDNNLSVVTDKHHPSWVFDTIGNVFGTTFDNYGLIGRMTKQLFGFPPLTC